MSIFFNEQPNNNHLVEESEVEIAQKTSFNEQSIEQVVAEWKQKYAYLSADFENVKRRSIKEYDAMRLEILTRICKPLLIIMDDFDRACDVAEKQKTDIEGFTFIRKALEKVLHDAGVVEMPVDVGIEFDPEKHEALMQVESVEHKSGQIVAVLQKGYLLQGTILRPAKVSVAQ